MNEHENECKNLIKLFNILFEPKLVYGNIPKCKVWVKKIKKSKDKNGNYIDLTLEEQAICNIEKKVNIIAKNNSKFIEKEDVFQEMCLLLVEMKPNLEDLINNVYMQQLGKLLNEILKKYRNQKQNKMETFNKYGKKIKINEVNGVDYGDDTNIKQKTTYYDIADYNKWISEEFGFGVKNSKEYELLKKIDFDEILKKMPRTKEILELIQQDYKYIDIAKMLNISRVQITIRLKKLREKLCKNYVGIDKYYKKDN